MREQRQVPRWALEHLRAQLKRGDEIINAVSFKAGSRELVLVNTSKGAAIVHRGILGSTRSAVLTYPRELMTFPCRGCLARNLLIDVEPPANVHCTHCGLAHRLNRPGDATLLDAESRSEPIVQEADVLEPVDDEAAAEPADAIEDQVAPKPKEQKVGKRGAKKRSPQKQGATRQPAKKAAPKQNAPARGASKSAAKEIAKRVAKKQAAKKAATKAAQKTGRKAAKRSVKKSPQRAAKKQAAKKAAAKTAKKTGRKAAKKSVKKSTRRAAKKQAAKRGSKKAVSRKPRASKTSTKKATKKRSKRSGTSPSRAAKKRAAKKRSTARRTSFTAGRGAARGPGRRR